MPSLKQELSALGNGRTGLLQGQYTAFRPDRELENLPARKGCCRTGTPSLLAWQFFRLAAARDTPRIGPEGPPRRVAKSTPGRTRTCNPRLRRPMLYPIELQGRLIRSGTISAPKMAQSWGFSLCDLSGEHKSNTSTQRQQVDPFPLFSTLRTGWFPFLIGSCGP